MEKHARLDDAKAAAALALAIQRTDARLRLPSSPSPAPAACPRDFDLDIFDHYQPRTLHEHIIADALAADTASRGRYVRFELGLLQAHLRLHPGPADPAECMAHVHHTFTARETAVLDLMLSLEDRLHQSAHTQAARLRQAARQRAVHGGR